MIAILITELTDETATLRITDFGPRFKHYERVARPAPVAPTGSRSVLRE